MEDDVDERGAAPRSVLIVEDAADLRMLFRMSLQRGGFLVAGEVATLAEALAAATARAPDVVLVDLGLPDASGTAVVAGLHEAVPDALIVVCSGSLDEPGTAAACRAAGAHAFLEKTAAQDVGVALSRLLDAS